MDLWKKAKEETSYGKSYEDKAHNLIDAYKILKDHNYFITLPRYYIGSHLNKEKIREFLKESKEPIIIRSNFNKEDAFLDGLFSSYMLPEKTYPQVLRTYEKIIKKAKNCALIRYLQQLLGIEQLASRLFMMEHAGKKAYTFYATKINDTHYILHFTGLIIGEAYVSRKNNELNIELNTLIASDTQKYLAKMWKTLSENKKDIVRKLEIITQKGEVKLLQVDYYKKEKVYKKYWPYKIKRKEYVPSEKALELELIQAPLEYLHIDSTDSLLQIKTHITALEETSQELKEALAFLERYELRYCPLITSHNLEEWKKRDNKHKLFRGANALILDASAIPLWSNNIKDPHFITDSRFKTFLLTIEKIEKIKPGKEYLITIDPIYRKAYAEALR